MQYGYGAVCKEALQVGYVELQAMVIRSVTCREGADSPVV